MKFWAPLYDYTRERAMAMAKEYGLVEEVPENDSGVIHLCTKCLNTTVDKVFCPAEQEWIPTIQWQPEQNLAYLRSMNHV